LSKKVQDIFNNAKNYAENRLSNYKVPQSIYKVPQGELEKLKTNIEKFHHTPQHAPLIKEVIEKFKKTYLTNNPYEKIIYKSTNKYLPDKLITEAQLNDYIKKVEREARINSAKFYNETVDKLSNYRKKSTNEIKKLGERSTNKVNELREGYTNEIKKFKKNVDSFTLPTLSGGISYDYHTTPSGNLYAQTPGDAKKYKRIF